MKRQMIRILALSALVTIGAGGASALAQDRDNNPPGQIGGAGTNWENPPGPRGGPGASRDRQRPRAAQRERRLEQRADRPSVNQRRAFNHRNGLGTQGAQPARARAARQARPARRR